MSCQDEAFLGGRRGAEQERGDDEGKLSGGAKGPDSTQTILKNFHFEKKNWF